MTASATAGTASALELASCALPRISSLSIVIPTLNEADGIVGQLSALQGLRLRGVEVIVADGEIGRFQRPCRRITLARRKGARDLLDPQFGHASLHGNSQALLNTGQIIFGIIVIGLIGLVSDFLFKAFNAWLFPWKLA